MGQSERNEVVEAGGHGLAPAGRRAQVQREEAAALGVGEEREGGGLRGAERVPVVAQRQAEPQRARRRQLEHRHLRRGGPVGEEGRPQRDRGVVLVPREEGRSQCVLPARRAVRARVREFGQELAPVRPALAPNLGRRVAHGHLAGDRGAHHDALGGRPSGTQTRASAGDFLPAGRVDVRPPPQVPQANEAVAVRGQDVPRVDGTPA
mmetsp:Transcript_7674/g.22535  ORF Transcript_7674/g.22535 Transcript_7674/m.22535 type:complete len:207 (-) Transcript_7674:1000-1620(-)